MAVGCAVIAVLALSNVGGARAVCRTEWSGDQFRDFASQHCHLILDCDQHNCRNAWHLI